jgi:hypothetical protein
MSWMAAMTAKVAGQVGQRCERARICLGRPEPWIEASESGSGGARSLVQVMSAACKSRHSSLPTKLRRALSVRACIPVSVIASVNFSSGVAPGPRRIR